MAQNRSSLSLSGQYQQAISSYSKLLKYLGYSRIFKLTKAGKFKLYFPADSRTNIVHFPLLQIITLVFLTFIRLSAIAERYYQHSFLSCVTL